jgi:hypothetical protein
MLFDRVVKSGDTVRHPFAGNASGETWNAKVYEVGTGAGGTDTEITTGISVASAVTGTALYQLTITNAGMTANRMYYAFVTRPVDGAVIRFSTWAYGPTNDIGQAADSDSTASVFGKIKHINDGLGIDSFFGGSTNLYSMLTGANGLSVIKGATDTLKTAIAGDVATAFTGIAGVTDMATALKKIYDSAANPWAVDVSAYSTAGQAGTMLKTVTGAVGLKTDAAAADYTNNTVQAKLRKLGEWVEARLPASGYANSTTDVAAGQAAIYSRMGAPAGASLAADIASVYSRLGAPAGASMSADVAAVKSQLDLVKGKTDLIGAAADTSSDATVFGKVAAVKSETALIKGKTDLIGAAADTSSDATLFGKTAAVKADTASIKTTGETIDNKVGTSADTSSDSTVFGKVADVKADTFSIDSKVGTSSDTSSASTVFGKVAAVQAVVDRLNKITNAQLLPIVPTEVASPAVSVTSGIAIKFELKVTDPSTGALEDPDTFTDGGTQYKAHVRVTDLGNAHWGARLYQDGAFTDALVVSGGGANEPVYSCTPLGGGAASEAFRRLKRETMGQYAGFVKILPTDNTTLNFVFQIVDSDPTATANTFMSWSTMVVRQPAATFPSPGAF